MTRTPFLFFVLFAAAATRAACAGEVFEHAIYDAVPLNGAWEMAYRPYAHESVECPRRRVGDGLPSVRARER